MFVGKLKDMKKVDMTPAGAKGAIKQVLLGPEQGWEGYVMRVITLEVGGNSPQHTHQWPHINYILSGNGVVMIDGVERVVEKDYAAYVPADVEHSFTNTGNAPMQFICIVPEIGEF